MSYEYSSEQAQLDFPNPYRIENILWSVRAGILLVCALALIFLARKHLAAQALGSFLLPVAIGAGLLVVAGWNFLRIGQQLRVFFGRGQPAGLAPELEADQRGLTDAAKALMQTVRQGALEFPVPKGALNGVLYSLVKDLITAPHYVQSVLQNRFTNLASYAFLLLAMLVASVFVWGTPAQSWVGLLFLALVVYLAVKPIANADDRAAVRFNLTQVVTLTLLAILGPVLLGFSQHALPDLSWAHFGVQAVILLLALTVIESVFFVAVKAQLDPPPPVSKVDTQDTVSFNADPNVLMQELEREMQRNWEHRIPNRRYARVLPAISLGAGAGNFSGQLLEETQPMAPAAFSRMDWSVVRAYPRFFWLMVIDLLGVLFTLAGAVTLTVFAVSYDPLQDWRPVFGMASLGLALVAVGGYAFRSAHTLWGRFDFESTLTWVEFEGSYVRSKARIGNQLQDRVFTERDVVNVENMTLRVWVMQLRSVVFGHHGQGSRTQRIITGMLSQPHKAEYLKNLVRQFAGEQSIVIAPTANEDARRMAAMGALNQLGGAAPAAPALTPAVTQGALLATAAAQAVQAFCTACGTSNAEGHLFCEQCGTTLQPA